jgi:hypothetical protein
VSSVDVGYIAQYNPTSVSPAPDVPEPVPVGSIFCSVTPIETSGVLGMAGTGLNG